MAKLKNDIEYEAICQRIEELLPMADNDTPWTDRRLIELDLISDLVADYEEEHFPLSNRKKNNLVQLSMKEEILSYEIA